MSKFYGAIGYAVSTEGNSGVWRDEIRRLNYYGDVIRDTRQYQTGDGLNDNLNISNQDRKSTRLNSSHRT